MSDVCRSYRLERDDRGMPARMIWRGDFVRMKPLSYLVCPRCRSRRMHDSRCFDCWWSAPVVERWRKL